MKAIAINTLTVFLFIIVFIILLPSINTIILGGARHELAPVKESNIIIKRDIYAMDNALEAAKIYLDTGLRFSVYQAMHDLGKKGGWMTIPEERKTVIGEKEYAIWYFSGIDLSPKEEEAMQGLRDSAKETFNKYTSKDYVFLEGFKVTLPSFNDVNIQNTEIGITANTPETDKFIYIERKINKDVVKLDKKIELSENFDINYLALFAKAKETSRTVSGKLRDIVTSKSKILKSRILLATPDESCENAYTREIGKDIESAKKDIIDTISGSQDIIFERTEGFSIKSELLQNEIDIEPRREGGSEPVCSYIYTLNVALKVSVADAQKSFAVSDNNEDIFVNPRFVFLVKHSTGAPNLVNIIKTADCQNDEKLINSFNFYQGTIEIAVRKYNLQAYTDNDLEKAEALVASLITKESGWNPEAKSPCGAAGIMQFTPATARKYDLVVSEYDFEFCSNECKIEGRVVDVSACNACTPDKCKPVSEDQRFDSYLSIDAGVRLITELIQTCENNLEKALNAYNTGTCEETQAPPGYVLGIIAQQNTWQTCIETSIAQTGSGTPAA